MQTNRESIFEYVSLEAWKMKERQFFALIAAHSTEILFKGDFEVRFVNHIDVSVYRNDGGSNLSIEIRVMDMDIPTELKLRRMS
jgi:hypothetical protein